MPKWKIQAVEPNTCEPLDLLRNFLDWEVGDPGFPVEVEGIKRTNGCRYYELWNSLSPPPQTPVVVCAVLRVCKAHAVPALVGIDGGLSALTKLKWVDGNWKDIKSYIKYQKDWFRWVNHVEWIARAPKDEFGDLQPMPPQIASFTTEPITPGSVTAPSQAEQDDLAQVYAWNREHNDRMGTSLEIMRSELKLSTDADREAFDEKVIWRFEGAGDTRLLYVNSRGLLNNQERNRVEGSVDIQFGPNKVVVEG